VGTIRISVDGSRVSRATDRAESSRRADGTRPPLLNAQPVFWHSGIAELWGKREGDMLVQMVSAAMGAGFAVSMWNMYKRMRDITR
jgi:hypothetical protein